ncbi:MAG: flagellar hook-associated protein FlgL [Desulfobacteraceae bacterium]|nr:flagellar hook-associated protein FlgL [Desulfobacteraceae bacterium]
MRVPNISMYVNSTYRLGKLSSDLYAANEVVSTQKRINEISDDPLGLSQVLTLKNSLGNLDQIERNINMGKSWITSIENAMDSINDLILDAKVDVTRLANDSITADERRDTITKIDHLITQIVNLGNTQVNGSYIFSGTETNTISLKSNSDLTEVVYNGNDTPFEIRTDRNSGVKVGRNGKETFWEDEIDINATNNTIMFKEDIGHGSASEKILEAVIPNGSYSKDTLEIAVRNALNQSSASDGYGVVYKVEYNNDEKNFSIREDGSFNGFIQTEFMWETCEDGYISDINTSFSINPDDLNITITKEDALSIDTPLPPGTEPFRLVWEGNGTWHVQNNPGYLIIPSYITGTADSVDIDFNDSGVADVSIRLDNAVRHSGEYIEFEIVSGKGDHSTGHEIGFSGNNLILAPPLSDTRAQSITELNIIDGTNDMIDVVETDSAGVPTTINVDIDTSGGTTTYTDMATLARSIELSLEAESLASGNGINYAVSYDAQASRFNIREDGSSLNRLDILWDTGANTAVSAGSTLGFYNFDDSVTYPVSDTAVFGPMTFDSTNNIIDFRETSIDGTLLGQRSITIPEGVYADPNDVATHIQTALRSASAWGVDYVVDYDNGTNRFMIKGSSADIKGFELLWSLSGENFDNNAAQMLGFDNTQDDSVTFIESDRDVVNIVIDGTNNKIDFKEITNDSTGERIYKLTASVEQKIYTSHAELAFEIEKALESESRTNGNIINYSVSFDDYTKKFTMKENGATLDSFHLQWQTGDNAPLSEGGTGESMGAILGFDTIDDLGAPIKSIKDVEWGIFNTLFDLKQYLNDNDRDGIERTIGRLEINYDNMTSRIVDAGMKYSRLEIRQTLTLEVGLSLEERRSNIEDADIVESIMKIKNIETAYQAALSSTARVMNISLLDYL